MKRVREEAPMRFVCRSKIQRATITEADTEQSGCIVIDEDLMDRVELFPGERVLVLSHASGEQLEVHVFGGARGSGEVSLSGPPALKIPVGDQVDILGFETTNEMIDPLVCCVDANNKFTRMLYS